MADIKLIVKIDANVYTRLFDNGIQDNEIATDDICEMARALRLGKPQETVTEFADRCRECGREKVLDKIFDEVCDIDDDIVFNPDSLECKRYVRLIKVMDIIDKYRGNVDEI